MLKIAAVLALAFLVSGCSTIQSYLYRDYAVQGGLDNYDALIESLQKSSPTLGRALVDQKCFEPVLSAADVLTCQAARNQAITAVAIISDGACKEHRKTIYGNEVSYNIVLGTLTSLFAGGAAIVNTERRKSILGALALFTNSERALISESVYKNILAFAVDNKIIEARRDKWREISGRFNDNMTAYPMTYALHDVIEYHQSCSFMNGLVKVLNEGTNSSTTQKIARLRTNLSLARAEHVNAAADQKAAIQARITAIEKELAALETQ